MESISHDPEADPSSVDAPTKDVRFSVLKSEGESSKHATIVLDAGNGTAGWTESYELDWCYEHHEDTEKLFLEEVNPIIQGVFNGADASIIAFGTRGSGKTQLIEGCEEKPGLASLAAAEILNICKNNKYSISISCYEIFQDHIFDILEQKEREVQVLEDGHGRTQLRGLSQNLIESISDFNRLCMISRKLQTTCTKSPSDSMIRSHKGLIFYVCEMESRSNVIGKLNFVDLAGYEDTTQKNNAKQLVMEMTRINKSLYALQNVVSALNSNERHVPYRVCKLTHMLKDFVRKENSQTLLVACLRPSPSQEKIRAVGMLLCDLAKKKKVISRSAPLNSPSNSRSQMISPSSKKLEASRFTPFDVKIKPQTTMTEERKLFDVGSPAPKSVKRLKLVKSPHFQMASPSKKQEASLFNSLDTKIKTKTTTSKERKLFDDGSPAPKSERLKLVKSSPFQVASPSSKKQEALHFNSLDTKMKPKMTTSKERKLFDVGSPAPKSVESLKLVKSLPFQMVGPSSKKQEASRFISLDTKMKPKTTTSKERKLFGDGSPAPKSMESLKLEESLPSQMVSMLSKKREASRFTSLDMETKPKMTMTEERKSFSFGSPVLKSVEKLNLEDKSSSHITFNVEFLCQDKENLKDTHETFPDLEKHGVTDEQNQFGTEILNKSESEEIREHSCSSNEMSPPLSERLKDMANSFRLLIKPLTAPPDSSTCTPTLNSFETREPSTPVSDFPYNIYKEGIISGTAHEMFKLHSRGLKASLSQVLLSYLKTATKEQLMELKGIGEKRAETILEIRAVSPEAFKDMNVLRDIGLSSKHVKEMVKGVLGDFYS